MHNMAKFDIIFLLKYLVELGTLQVTDNKRKLIYNDQLQLKYYFHYRIKKIRTFYTILRQKLQLITN